MNTAVVCISSNVANRDAKVASAYTAIAAAGTVTARCEPFEHPALNGRDNDYTNLVLALDTPLGLDELTALAKDTERDLGRTPASKSSGIVPADIDIVIWNGRALRPDEAATPYFVHGYTRMAPCDSPEV